MQASRTFASRPSTGVKELNGRDLVERASIHARTSDGHPVFVAFESHRHRGRRAPGPRLGSGVYNFTAPPPSQWWQFVTIQPAGFQIFSYCARSHHPVVTRPIFFPKILHPDFGGTELGPSPSLGSIRSKFPC